MIVHDLSADVIARLIRTDLSIVDDEPDSPIGDFEFNRCTGGIGCFIGRPPWECHTDGDELLLVLSGTTQLTIVDDIVPTSQTSRWIHPGELVVIQRARWHNNNAPGGVTLLHLTPTHGNEHSWERPAFTTSTPR